MGLRGWESQRSRDGQEVVEREYMKQKQEEG